MRVVQPGGPVASRLVGQEESPLIPGAGPGGVGKEMGQGVSTLAKDVREPLVWGGRPGMASFYSSPKLTLFLHAMQIFSFSP